MFNLCSSGGGRLLESVIVLLFRFRLMFISSSLGSPRMNPKDLL